MYKLVLYCTVALFLHVFMLPYNSFAAHSGHKINSAFKALQEDKPQQALSLLTSVLEKTKPNISALLIAGNAHMQLDAPAKALKIYERGVKLYPDHVGIIQNKAIALYDLEKFRFAGDAFVRVATLQRKEKSKKSKKKADSCPDWYKSRYQATACYYKAQKYGLALKTVLPLMPHSKYSEHTDTQKLLAHIYIAQEKWKKAIHELSSLVARYPESREFWMLLAEVNIRANKLKNGAAALQVAYKLKAPTKNEAMRLARIYLQVDAPLLASKSILSCKHLTASEYDLLAVAYERAGEYSQAATALQKAINCKGTPKRFFELGKLFYRNQNYTEAIQPLRVASKKLKKKKGLSIYLLGQCFLNTAQNKQAKKMFMKAKKYRSVRSHATHALSLLNNMEQLKNSHQL